MKIEVGAEWLYAVVDVADNSTTVFNGPCLLRGVTVHTVLSAQAMPIKDNTTTVASLAASAAVGTQLDCMDMRIETSLIVDPNDAGTGMVTVVYKPNHEGLAGSGA